MPAESSVLEQDKSCGSVSCLINMEPSELLRLQPSEPIASESVYSGVSYFFWECTFKSAIRISWAYNTLTKKCLISLPDPRLKFTKADLTLLFIKSVPNLVQLLIQGNQVSSNVHSYPELSNAHQSIAIPVPSTAHSFDASNLSPMSLQHGL